jgi:hypothetical protein
MCRAGVDMRSTAWQEIGQGFLDDRAAPHKSQSRIEETAQPLRNSTKRFDFCSFSKNAPEIEVFSTQKNNLGKFNAL